jgi:hypothetical protein
VVEASIVRLRFVRAAAADGQYRAVPPAALFADGDRKTEQSLFLALGPSATKKHTGFVRFLRALLVRSPGDLSRIAYALGFGRSQNLDRWVVSIQTLAYDLQNLAPTEARDGPNPEYPWPYEAPSHHPAGYRFVVWRQLSDTGRGRKLIEVTATIVNRFEVLA